MKINRRQLRRLIESTILNLNENRLDNIIAQKEELKSLDDEIRMMSREEWQKVVAQIQKDAPAMAQKLLIGPRPDFGEAAYNYAVDFVKDSNQKDADYLDPALKGDPIQRLLSLCRSNPKDFLFQFRELIGAGYIQVKDPAINALRDAIMVIKPDAFMSVN